MSEPVISVKKFKDVNIDDPFFESLKGAYNEFPDWFARKADENAYVSYSSEGGLQAFLYLKPEKGPITDIEPPLDVPDCLKVGTFKVDAHGTKLGERFVKIIVDTALVQGLPVAYLTIFPEHEPLIRILETFGFTKRGTKPGPNGTEDVYAKDMGHLTGNLLLDYPMVHSRKHNKWMMSIYADYHTDLFPDSILRTERPTMLQDTSHTNGIHKVYVGAYRAFPQVSPGDCLVIYRCVEKDSKKSAWYGSVATSLCVVEEIQPARSFGSAEKFITYCKKYSVFDEAKLRSLYPKTGMHAVLMTYNLAFPRRPTLGSLVEARAVPHPSERHYMGFLPLSDDAFKKILELGGIREGYVIY